MAGPSRTVSVRVLNVPVVEPASHAFFERLVRTLMRDSALADHQNNVPSRTSCYVDSPGKSGNWAWPGILDATNH